MYPIHRTAARYSLNISGMVLTSLIIWFFQKKKKSNYGKIRARDINSK